MIFSCCKNRGFRLQLPCIGSGPSHDIVLRKAYFRGLSSAPPKYKGRSNKTEPKSPGGSLAVGNYLQSVSSPPGVGRATTGESARVGGPTTEGSG